MIAPFKIGDPVVYERQNELFLAQVVSVVETHEVTLKYFIPSSGKGLEESVDYREGLLHNHNEALLVRTGTFANCTPNVENSTVFTKVNVNVRSANVSCRGIRFAAEAGSFIGKPKAIIVGVLSTSNNFRWRNVIRSTWAADSTVFFVIAGSWDDIEEEYHRYKDIIWVDLEESFRLITFKSSMFFQVVNIMASELNLTYSHALKTDDDSYVAMGSLEQLVKEKHPSSVHYWGSSSMKYAKPLRNPKSRYYVSLDQYPEPYFPPYVAGAAVLAKRAQRAEHLHGEDEPSGAIRCSKWSVAFTENYIQSKSDAYSVGPNKKDRNMMFTEGLLPRGRTLGLPIAGWLFFH